jgi:hypothetical protein
VPHLNCSVCQPPTTSFRTRPIGTIATLAIMLKLTVSELEELASSASQRYRIAKRIKKPDGSIRVCFDALGSLKDAQGRIQCMILNLVNFPIYLQGGIKDRDSPRGQKANAARHVESEIVITEDIKQFFPSIRRAFVFDIWHKFFCFPPPIADILTKLTTKDGCLPQGTKTSALLANLVFWDIECDLVTDFHLRGIRYTRLIDEITCSSKDRLTPDDKSYIIDALHKMVRRKGLILNTAKQTILRANERQTATKLVINRKTSLPPEQRSSIRSLVRDLKRVPTSSRSSNRYRKQYSRAAGLVSYMKQHHPDQADQLFEVLDTIRPTVCRP